MFNMRSQRKENKEIEEDGLIYKINEDKKTAEIIGIKSSNIEINIPRSVYKKSNEYIITSISKGSFQFSNVKSVTFPADSELLYIGNLAFSESTIESFTIPPHLTIIKECAFNECRQLRKIEIPSNSGLQTIEKYAFTFTLIENFTIPPHLTEISECMFCNCQQLRTIEIPSNSELQSIDTAAFDGTSIEQIEIPNSLIDLKEGWCCNAIKLTKINVSKNNPRYISYCDKMIIGKSSIESENNYDVLVFCSRNVKTIEIPNFIKTIGPYAFERCFQLSVVKIINNTNLQKIDKFAFLGTKIENFTIPSQVNQILENAFSNCQKLLKFEIPTNSELQLIDKCAFYESAIESFIIPQHVNQIGEFAFSCCKKLCIIQIEDNSKLNKVNQNIFDGCNQIILMIPVNSNVHFIKNIKKSISKKNDYDKLFSNVLISTRILEKSKPKVKESNHTSCNLF